MLLEKAQLPLMGKLLTVLMWLTRVGLAHHKLVQPMVISIMLLLILMLIILTLAYRSIDSLKESESATLFPQAQPTKTQQAGSLLPTRIPILIPKFNQLNPRFAQASPQVLNLFPNHHRVNPYPIPILDINYDNRNQDQR